MRIFGIAVVAGALALASYLFGKRLGEDFD